MGRLWQAYIDDEGKTHMLTSVEADTADGAQELALRKIARDPELKHNLGKFHAFGKVTRRIVLVPPSDEELHKAVELTLPTALLARMKDTARREGIELDELCSWGLSELLDGLDRERLEARRGLGKDFGMRGREVDDLGALRRLSARIVPDEDEEG